MEFDERNKKGTEAVNKTIYVLETYNKKWQYIVDPIKYEEAKRNNDIIGQRDLALADRLYGDLLIEAKFRCDVKKNAISLRSISDFIGDYFILWNNNFLNCIMLNPCALQELDKEKAIELVSETEFGFYFEQLQYFEHIPFEDFIKSL